ncbi:MAG: response regulator [Planctomycetes bacterium]|nr:response regulator [Planctomycetota bacterium]
MSQTSRSSPTLDSVVIVVQKGSRFDRWRAIVGEFLRALRSLETYDPRTNLYAIFGFLWGIPIPSAALALHLHLAGATFSLGGLSAFVLDHPIHLFFLAHPLLFAIVFGAMGTIRRRLDERVSELVRELNVKVKVLYEASQDRLATFSCCGVIELVLSHLREVVSWDLAGCVFLGDERQCFWRAPDRPAPAPLLARFSDYLLEQYHEASGTRVEATEGEWSDRPTRFHSPERPVLSRIGTTLVLPLRLDGRVVGLLSLARESAQGFSKTETRLAHILVHHASRLMEQQGAIRTEEHRHLDRLVRHLPVAVVLLDSGGKPLLSNPLAEEFLGLAAGRDETGALVGLAGVPLADLRASPNPVDLVLTGDSPRIFAAQAARLPSIRGGAEDTLICARDVTLERHRERREAQEERLVVLGEATGGIAHDFNNLLAVIGGYCESLLAGMNPGDPLRADVEEIRMAGHRAARLTRQLLLFGKQGEHRPEVLDVNGVVAGMERFLRRAVGGKLDLEFRLAPDLPRVLADSGELEQVLANLVVNARDATPEGGKILVGTSDSCFCDPVVQARPEAKKIERCVRLAVSDTGSGMTPEVARRIFEPFFSTKPKGKGTGLGLATVRRIVDRCGGRIEVETAPGKGSKFLVFLPATMESTTKTAASVGQEPPSGGGELVLLVEDEVPAQRLLVRILQAANYRVLAFSDGSAALEAVRSRAEPVDLLLTDILLPGMLGTALAQNMLRDRPGLRIVFMSGHSKETVARDHPTVDVARLLQKPFSREELLRSVRGALAEPRALRSAGD